MAWSLELKWVEGKLAYSSIGFTEDLHRWISLSLFYRHSAVTVIEDKAIRSEFPRVVICEGNREMRHQRSAQPHRGCGLSATSV